ncbi:hypothetical protein FDP41_010738 [Naegleria fowleri]|uniref:Sugar phosphate transporter domain-containing protein n=1 Tax=Naegleria fowleri TaxID=5763 RepID=A0A6A5CBW5_NAEFO|nr:uncharacterized protein FDP41_010738 [Naegleria fowleri]KAF0982759.1 hypothetical protein FDP41_010738 [Naegleria fowleri]CAG4709153.1 unnamed protein product [Naegleria fowleri]
MSASGSSLGDSSDHPQVQLELAEEVPILNSKHDHHDDGSEFLASSSPTQPFQSQQQEETELSHDEIMSDSISEAHDDFDLSLLTTTPTTNFPNHHQNSSYPNHRHTTLIDSSSSSQIISNFISSYRSLLLSVQYTLQYFLASILLTLFIKYTVSYSGLRYPLMFLSLQMFVNCSVCGVVSWFLIKKRLESVVYGGGNSNHHSTNAHVNKTITPNWREIFGHLFNWKTFKTLAPFGVLTGFDFGCSTLSLKYITVSLYTMLKSAIPVFVMIISFIFKLETVKIVLVISIVLISVGIGMTSRGSIHYDIFGFILVIVAVIFAAVRLVFAQYILHHNNTQVLYTRLSSEEIGNNNDGCRENQNNENQENAHSEEELEDNESNTLLLETGTTPQAAGSKTQVPTTDLTANTTTTEEEQHLEYFYAKDSGEEFRASKIEISSVQVFFYSSPIIGLTVLPFAVILESWRILYDFVNITQAPNVDVNAPIQYLRFMFIVKFIGMILVGSFLGVILNVSEFLLIKQTSSLTLTVVSIFKELLLIMISVMVFGDRIGVMGAIGYGITLIGIVIYKFQRLAELRSANNENNH